MAYYASAPTRRGFTYYAFHARADRDEFVRRGRGPRARAAASPRQDSILRKLLARVQARLAREQEARTPGTSEMLGAFGLVVSYGVPTYPDPLEK